MTCSKYIVNDDGSLNEAAIKTVDVSYEWPYMSFTGKCPQCKDDINFKVRTDVISGVEEAEEEPSGLRRGSFPFRRRRIKRSHEFTVICNCTHDHPEQPEGKSGCGAAWTMQTTWRD